MLNKTNEIIKQNSINFIKKDGQILFTAEEIGKQLGYQNPAIAINKIMRRNYQELLAYSVETNLVSTDGKTYNKRVFTEEGVYILSMLAKTPKARDFRKRVAELLKEIRQNDIELAKEISYQQGMEYGQSLPAVQIETKKSYLNGLEEGRKIQKRHDTWRKMEKAVDYLGKGVSLKDTAKLVKLRPDTIRERFQRLGLWEQVKNGDLWFNMSGKKYKNTTNRHGQPEQLSLL